MIPAELQSDDQDFTVRKSDKAKRVILRVNPKTRGFELIVPKRVSYKYALEFAATQKAWMEKQKAAMGEEEIIPVIASEARALKRDARKILTDLTMEKVKRLPERPRVTPLSPLQGLFDFMNPTPRWEKDIKIRINDARTQWGSCHPDGRISYSWRLMLAPEAARDYVVAHEVAHLIHNNHSRKFWELCKQLSVDFEGGHAWMKQNGHTLHRYTPLSA